MRQATGFYLENPALVALVVDAVLRNRSPAAKFPANREKNTESGGLDGLGASASLKIIGSCGLSPEVPLNARRRLQHFQRPTPSHVSSISPRATRAAMTTWREVDLRLQFPVRVNREKIPTNRDVYLLEAADQGNPGDMTKWRRFASRDRLFAWLANPRESREN